MFEFLGGEFSILHPYKVLQTKTINMNQPTQKEMHPEGQVSLRVEGAVMTIEFGHPRHNNLPSHLLQDLVTALDQASNDPKVKVVILLSSGDRTFCAGASFQELVSIENQAQGLEFFSGFARVINAMRRCTKFIIVQVQGKAVGGGVGLIAAADYALAVDTASVKLSELTIGIGPFVIAPAVERKIGLAALSELSIDAAEFRSAHWAEQKGLYAQVFTQRQDLDQAVAELSNRLSEYSSQAMSQWKSVLWSGTEDWDELLADRASISGRLVLSPQTKAQLVSYQKK